MERYPRGRRRRLKRAINAEAERSRGSEYFQPGALFRIWRRTSAKKFGYVTCTQRNIEHQHHT